MQLEISEGNGRRLAERASAAGLDIDLYLGRLLQEDLSPQQLSTEDERKAAVQAQIDYLKSSADAGGRDGRPWREFIHEGHKY